MHKFRFAASGIADVFQVLMILGLINSCLGWLMFYFLKFKTKDTQSQEQN